MIDKKNITGIILAGGKSSRMGSDKGLLNLNGATFLSHIIDAVKPLVNDIIIVSNSMDYDTFGYKKVADIIEDSGPLAGLYTGLKHSKTDYNLVLSCDVPLINESVLKILIDEIDYKHDVVQIKSENKTMPLIAVYRKHCLNTCFELLNKGERRLRLAVDQMKTKTIEIDSKWNQYVRNINTIEQYNALRNEAEY